jgi:uncharacterized protein YdeI (YjbR/CyaY-like superfamily)
VPDQELPVLEFASQESWRAWLDKNHSKVDGAWIKYAKKGSGIQSVSYQQAVEIALCYGWIDGKVQSIDDAYYRQRFTPRRPRSKWSKINRDKALALIEAGAMHAAGLAEVERAKADGRWDAAYDSFREIAVPEDLQEQLDKNPVAREFFGTLTKSNRYAILYQIEDAKRQETRVRRITKFIALLNERKGPYG